MSRKTVLTSFFVFCALAIAAAPAFAQVAFQVSSLPQQVRIEGLTETMGAVQATNTATTAGTVKSGSSITVLYSAAITNLSTTTPASNQGVLTCSAGVTNTACAAGAANVSVGVASGGQITVSFGGDTYFAAGAYILVSQVRVNVNALGSAATAVTATLSGTSSAPTTNPITFTNASVPVAAIVNPSLTVSRKASAGSIQTCSIPGGGSNFKIQVTERYPAALTSVNDEGCATCNGGGAGGFTPNFLPTNGSAVIVSLSGIPSGMAVIYNGIDVANTSGTILATTPGTVLATSTGGAISYSFPIIGATAGAANATNTTQTGVVESISFSFNIGLPGAGALSATTGALPPIGTTASVVAAIKIGPVQTSPVVAFADNTQGTTTVATISDCVTNMLFPYVTNQAGYDTSFSIANTTSDDLAFGAGNGATAQSGTCTLSFWPTTDQTAVVLGTATSVTTPSVPAGGVYAFSQSGTSFSGQSGYMIAVCRFLNAHGFAFLTNGFAQAAGPQLSHGYLGLILPNPISGRAAAGGEVLAQ